MESRHSHRHFADRDFDLLAAGVVDYYDCLIFCASRFFIVLLILSVSSFLVCASTAINKQREARRSLYVVVVGLETSN